jgi:hypothetical protein
MTILSMTTSGVTGGPVSSPPFQPHWDLFPSFYVAPRAPLSFFQQIDGDLTKSAWEKAPWSAAFGDIQGDDAPEALPLPSIPPALTRFKALWDDDHLYIGALLYPSDAFPTQAHFTERNSPIYQKDSDFEVFCDFFQNVYNHNYKELEVNAINTVWNLMLDKPYLNGGVEHSGRVATDESDPLFYKVHSQKTAVKVLEGVLNNNVTGAGALWSVEIALAFSDMNVTATTSTTAPTTIPKHEQQQQQQQPSHAPQKHAPPAPGSHMRINFSRVELQGDINWTWQPQRVYSASAKKYQGQVNMHLPESWGYLVFGGDDGDHENTSGSVSDNEDGNDNTLDGTRGLQPVDIDPTWPAQVAAMHVYYAEDAYRDVTGRYTYDLNDLVPYMDVIYINPFTVNINRNWVKDGYRAVVADQNAGILVTVEQDRKLCVSVASKNDDNGGVGGMEVS